MADKDKVYIAIDSGVSTVPNNDTGKLIFFRKGERFRGNHPLVKQAPEQFIAEDADDAPIEWPTKDLKVP